MLLLEVLLLPLKCLTFCLELGSKIEQAIYKSCAEFSYSYLVKKDPEGLALAVVYPETVQLLSPEEVYMIMSSREPKTVFIDGFEEVEGRIPIMAEVIVLGVVDIRTPDEHDDIELVGWL